VRFDDQRGPVVLTILLVVVAILAVALTASSVSAAP
jgi:hypothetical protein